MLMLRSSYSKNINYTNRYGHENPGSPGPGVGLGTSELGETFSDIISDLFIK